MLFPEQGEGSGFDVIQGVFDASSEVYLRSSLSSTHDAVIAAPFDHNVHHRGHCAEAAYGCLKPLPTKRLRRANLHLSYSTTLARLHDTITPLLRYYGPVRHPLAFDRLPGLAGYTTYLAPVISHPGRKGFTNHSMCPCHHAIASTPPRWEVPH